MRFAKFLLLLFLCCGISLCLVACEGSPDPQKYPITLEKVRTGLAGQAVTGLGDSTFTIDGPTYVEGLKVSYDGKQGTAEFLLRTVNPSSKGGINGTVRAHYEFSSGNWQLRTLVADAKAQMLPAYAQRLTELTDFPLHFAANIGDEGRLEQALESGAEVNAPEAKKGSTAVMFASERGFLPIVKRLVEAGADVTIPNQFGYTALHASSSGNHLEVAELLIEQGADVNAVEERGRSPLFFAAEQNSLELAQLLTGKGAFLEARDRNQWTPLYAAVDKGSLEVARFLIEQGAEVKSSKTGSSRSPLLAASYSGNVEMVKLLIDAGADVHAKIGMGHSPYRGMTALKMAEAQGHTEVVALLKAAGAE